VKLGDDAYLRTGVIDHGENPDLSSLPNKALSDGAHFAALPFVCFWPVADVM
jgi:hypothetical protein